MRQLEADERVRVLAGPDAGSVGVVTGVLVFVRPDGHAHALAHRPDELAQVERVHPLLVASVQERADAEGIVVVVVRNRQGVDYSLAETALAEMPEGEVVLRVLPATGAEPAG